MYVECPVRSSSPLMYTALRCGLIWLWMLFAMYSTITACLAHTPTVIWCSLLIAWYQEEATPVLGFPKVSTWP